jgi:hypothetical protein
LKWSRIIYVYILCQEEGEGGGRGKAIENGVTLDETPSRLEPAAVCYLSPLSNLCLNKAIIRGIEYCSDVTIAISSHDC